MKESPASLPDEAPPPAGEATSSPRSAPPPPAHPSRRPHASESTNFEYEDSEWDVGIGNLIIDLDADIEKSASPVKASPMPSGTSPPSPPTSSSPANVASSAPAPKHGPVVRVPQGAPAETSGLKMKIKRTKPSPGTRSTEPKHEIVKAVDGVPGPVAVPAPAPALAALPVLGNNNNNNGASPAGKRAPPASQKRDKAKEVGGKQKAPVAVASGAPGPVLAPPAAVNGANGIVALGAAVVAKNGNESPPAKKWRAAGHLAADKVTKHLLLPFILCFFRRLHFFLCH